MQENTPIRLAISRYAQKYSQNRTTDMMVDRCRIYKPGAPGYNPSTGRSTNTAGDLKYEGPCRLWEVPGGQQIVVGDEEITITKTQFSIPYWVMPLPEEDDIVVMIESVDPDLVGRTLSIQSVVRGGGLRSSRLFQVQIAESKKSTW